MGFEIRDEQSVDQRIATRLKALRLERGWSLNQLAERSSVSRATLSRLENAEVSATANVLGRLCAAYGLTLSRLMVMIENDFVPLIRPVDQPLWMDPETGYRRRGIGRALMDELERAAEHLGRRLITLDTRTGDAAEPLYTSIGYETVGTIPDFCHDPIDGRLHPTTIMYKVL